MQTPPDSDPEAGGHDEGGGDADHLDISFPGTANGGARHHRRLAPTGKTYQASRTKTKVRTSHVRRQKTTTTTTYPEAGPDVAFPTRQSLVVHKPTSATTRLRSELIAMMIRTRRNDAWFDLLPSRIGQSEAVDSAAKAIIKAVEHASVNTVMTQESCLGSYGNAITTLRDGMGRLGSSDEMLLTVSLLVTFERIFAYTSVPLKSHMHGVVAVLMNQTKTSSKPPSEMTRAIHYGFWPVTFIGPCVMGVPSPFESSRWLESEPVFVTKEKMKTPWKVVGRLRKLTNEHFIRLPRLVMLAKSLQTTHDPEQADVAFALAKSLIGREDLDAENELLHHVQIQKTKEGPGTDVTPYSMHFATVSEYEAAMHYWSTRVLLSRLCRRLSGLYPTKYQQHVLPPKPELEAQITRMSANMLMACQWGLDRGEIGENIVILNLVAMWGVLNDYDVFAARGMMPEKVRAFLRYCGQCIMRPTGADPGEEVGRRLHAASEIFVGGQTRGVLAFTFRKPVANG